MGQEKNEHPSVKFLNGEVKDFTTAMQVLREQQIHEYNVSIDLARKYTPAEVGSEVSLKQRGMASLEEQIKQAEHIYDLHVTQAVKRAADAMRQTNDPLLEEIADCLDLGDYSRLAI